MDRDPNQWARRLDNPTRNHLFCVADNLAAIAAWRETLASNQRPPSTIRHTKRRYEAAHRVEVAKQAGEQVLSPSAKLKAALAESEENKTRAEAERDKWKHKAETAGSALRPVQGHADDIGKTIAGNVTPSRAKAIAAAITNALKQKEAHAG